MKRDGQGLPGFASSIATALALLFVSTRLACAEPVVGEFTEESLFTTTHVFSARAASTDSGYVAALSGSRFSVGWRDAGSGAWSWTVLDEEPNYGGEAAIASHGSTVIVARPVGILIRIYRSTDGGRTFVGPYNMTLIDPGVTAPVREMVMTRHPDGVFLIAFTRENEGSPTLGYVLASSDDGQTWTAPMLAFGGASTLSQIHLGAHRDGYFLSYAERVGEFGSLHLCSSTDGLDWRDEVLSRRSGGDIGASALHVRDDVAILALDPAEGGELVFWRRNGGAWSASTLPMPGSRSAPFIHMTSFADGRIMLLRDEADDALHVLATADAGETWRDMGVIDQKKGRLIGAFPREEGLDLCWRRPGALVNDGRIMWRAAAWTSDARTVLSRLPGTPMNPGKIAAISVLADEAPPIE